MIEKCGCFATRHPFHNSCIECGSIFCERECNFEKCYFCDANLVPKLSSDEAQLYYTDVNVLKAYKLKVLIGSF